MFSPVSNKVSYIRLLSLMLSSRTFRRKANVLYLCCPVWGHLYLLSAEELNFPFFFFLSEINLHVNSQPSQGRPCWTVLV